jgi:hypothetical protein
VFGTNEPFPRLHESIKALANGGTKRSNGAYKAWQHVNADLTILRQIRLDTTMHIAGNPDTGYLEYINDITTPEYGCIRLAYTYLNVELTTWLHRLNTRLHVSYNKYIPEAYLKKYFNDDVVGRIMGIDRIRMEADDDDVSVRSASTT